MPDTYAVQPRDVLGKKVRRLRREQIVPGNIFGRGLESMAVQIPYADARIMLNTHGRNSLIEVAVEGEGKPRPVVVRAIDVHPLSGDIRHIDFYQVDLRRPITADVSVVLIGESPAVENLNGILVHGSETVSIEALPGDIPEHLEISIESLEEFDQQLLAGDLQLPEGVTLLSPEDLMLARIARPRLEEPEEEVEEGEELPEGVTEEGEAPTAEAEQRTPEESEPAAEQSEG